MMNKTYLKLFTELARTITLMSEQVMEYNHKNNDEKGENTAQIMRDDYTKLYDRMNEAGFDPDTLTRADYAKLLVAAIIATQNIENRIENEKKALQGYKIDTIPKLNRIIDETKTDEEAVALANQIFVITDESNT